MPHGSLFRGLPGRLIVSPVPGRSPSVHKGSRRASRKAVASVAFALHSSLVSTVKRLFDVARANLTDFASGFVAEDAGVLTEEERAQLARDLEEAEQDANSAQRAGAAAGRAARRVKDRAEEAWERAFEAAKTRSARAGQPIPQMDPRLARLRWLRTLELGPEATEDEIRGAYRKLMRKYHPDRYASDPEKYKAATEVAQKITEAYNGLKAG